MAFLSLTTKQSGDHAEAIAKQFLERQKLQVVEQNYRCRQGEIDLVMKHKHCLVFVEVRCRKNSRFGSAIETIDTRKQRKLIRAALHFLSKNKGFANYSCRFDVIGIEYDQAQQSRLAQDNCHIEWIQDAFQQ
ncbi:MAG: YraN family protein [Pseudomonadota bacterium]